MDRSVPFASSHSSTVEQLSYKEQVPGSNPGACTHNLLQKETPKMRRLLALLLVIPLLLLAGCPKEGETPRPRPTKAPPLAEPNPVQQPEPPAADPNPHNNEHEVKIQINWVGERSGKVTVLLNGVAVVEREDTGLSKKDTADHIYRGVWVRYVTPVKKGDRISVVFAPEYNEMKSVISIYQNSRLIVAPKSCQRGPCSSNGQIL